MKSDGSNRYTHYYTTPYDTHSPKRYVLLSVLFVIISASSANVPELVPTREASGLPAISGDPERANSRYWEGYGRYFPNIANYLQLDDPSLQLYREDMTRRAVIDFFSSVVGNESIAVSVMHHAERNDIPLTLAFTVAFIESSYRTNVVNYNSRSIDRGLFQLNDRTFPHLDEGDFFHVDTNARYAMEHLRYTLDRGGQDYRTAIAIYNAGEGRVLAGLTPASTQLFVQRATAYRSTLLARFHSYIERHFPPGPLDIAIGQPG